jgi:hypothetical protein
MIQLCFLLLIYSSSVFAETKDNSTSFTSIFTELPGDYIAFGQQLKQPKEWRLIGLTLGSSLLLYSDDQNLWEKTSDYGRSNSYKHFWSEVEEINGGYWQIGASAFFISWGLMGDQRALRTSFQIARGIISSGMIVQVLKRSTGRQSPNKQTEPRGKWSGYPGESTYRKDVASYDAVPSGHLQSAMVTFLVIAENYPEQEWIQWVGWPMMGVFSYSLVATNIHWWSDFPIAAYLSYRFAKIVTRKNNLPKKQTSDFDWEVFPTVSPSGNSALNLNITF